MITVGAYEAKTHLSELLDRVTEGEQITITKHRVPVARLVPAEGVRRQPVRDVIAAVRQFRVGRALGKSSLRELIEEGRR